MKPQKTPFDAHAVLHDLRHYLPAQAPLKDFIHHNPLPPRPSILTPGSVRGGLNPSTPGSARSKSNGLAITRIYARILLGPHIKSVYEMRYRSSFVGAVLASALAFLFQTAGAEASTAPTNDRIEIRFQSLLFHEKQR